MSLFQTKMNLKYLPCCIKFYYDHFYWSLIAALLVFFERNGDTTRCVVNFFLTSSPRRQVISIHHLDIGPLSCFLLVFQHSRNEERSEKEFFFSLFFLLLFPSFSERNDNWNSKKVSCCAAVPTFQSVASGRHISTQWNLFFFFLFFSFFIFFSFSFNV